MSRHILLIAPLVAACGLAPAQADPPPVEETRTVTALVYDFASLAPSVHADSRAALERILQPVGLRIAWVDCRRGARVLNAGRCEIPRRDDVFLRFVEGRGVAHNQPHCDYLGFSDPDWAGRGMITMLVKNIEALRRGTAWQFSTLLGHAIAHEFGHLFGGLEHTTAGLMSAYWTSQRLSRMTEIGLAMSNSEIRQFRETAAAYAERQPRPQLASTGSEPASSRPSGVSAAVARSTN